MANVLIICVCFTNGKDIAVQFQISTKFVAVPGESKERAPTSVIFQVLKWFDVTQIVVIPKEGFISFKKILKF